MGYFTYQGIRFHYTREGEGEPILLIHGLGGNVVNWLYQRNHFKRHRQVIAVDLPGHGQSEGGLQLHFQDYRNIINQLLAEELQLRDVLVCGISMGGKVALDLAYHYPEKVGGLLLADTFAGLDEEEKKRRNAVWELLREPGDGVNRWVARVIEEMGLDPAGPIAKGFHKGMLTNRLDFLYDLFQQSAGYDQRAQLPAISAPAVILHGERDRFIPFSCAEELQRGLPDAELHVIPGCGHLPHVEQPKVFNEFMEKLKRKMALRA